MKYLSIPFSILFYSLFLFNLCLFQPIQWVCLHVFGYHAHRLSVAILNLLNIIASFTIGAHYTIKGIDTIPEGVPIIFVCNHQSMFDIIPVFWFFRKFEPKFVSKIELGQGIPSISYNLRHGGSVLIDRKDPRQALPELKKMGEYIEQHKRSVVIYPEGTRSKDGVPKKFAESGVKILCKYAPSAYVVPLTVNNSWKVYRYGSFPLGLCANIQYIVHPAISVKDTKFPELMQQAESAVVSAIIHS